jgi:hypothetical protein
LLDDPLASKFTVADVHIFTREMIEARRWIEANAIRLRKAPHIIMRLETWFSVYVEDLFGWEEDNETAEANQTDDGIVA